MNFVVPDVICGGDFKFLTWLDLSRQTHGGLGVGWLGA